MSLKNIHFFLCLFSATLVICSCSKPTHLVAPRLSPMLYDDGSRSSLTTVIKHQMDYLSKLPPDKHLYFADTSCSSEDLIDTLSTFSSMVEQNLSPIAFDTLLHQNFAIYQAAGRDNASHQEMLVTGYYEPLLQGSLKKEPPFVYPLYKPPADLVRFVDTNGKKRHGRLSSQGTTLPYWTRADIEKTSVLSGYELVYLKDKFDAFLLHIQGSGRIQLPDGSTRFLQYGANNGHPYTSIGRVLVDENKLSLAEVDIPAIQRYFDNNPEDMDRILHANERFIFFNWGKGDGPLGSSGEPLTPMRSIAIDPESLPMGSIGYLITRKPVLNKENKVVDWKILHRFVFPQDSGSAIQGPGRVDFFWGNSQYAEMAAGRMKEKGKLYFLIKKECGASQ